MTSWRWCGATFASFAVALTLSSCSSPAARDLPPKAKVATPYLCQVIPKVDRLIVTRRAPGNEFQFTFPSVVTVHNASAAHAVASAACELPYLPPGAYNCPVEFLVSYQLDFAVKGEKGMGGEIIDLHPTGCQGVTGLKEGRTPTPSFYRLLARTMGLRDYNNFTFGGTFSKAR
jgi:hypothetical protein